MLKTPLPSQVGYKFSKSYPMTKTRFDRIRREARRDKKKVSYSDLLYIGLYLLNFSSQYRKTGFNYIRYLAKKVKFSLAEQFYQDIYEVVKRPLYYTNYGRLNIILKQLEFKENYSHIASELTIRNIYSLRTKMLEVIPYNYIWYTTSLIASIDIKSLNQLTSALVKCTERIEQEGMWKLYSLGLYLSNDLEPNIDIGCPLSTPISVFKPDYVNHFIEHHIPDYYNNCEEQIALFKSQFEKSKDLFSNDMLTRHFLVEMGKIILSVDKEETNG